MEYDAGGSPAPLELPPRLPLLNISAFCVRAVAVLVRCPALRFTRARS